MELIFVVIFIIAIAFYIAKNCDEKKHLTRGDILDIELSVMQEVHEQEMATMNMKMYCEDKKDVVFFVGLPLFGGGVIVHFLDGTSFTTNDGRNFDDVIKEKREEMKLKPQPPKEID